MPVYRASESPLPSDDELANRVTTRIEELAKLMGLADWNIRLAWRPVGQGMVMQTCASPEYFQATIDVDLNDLGSENLSCLDEYIRHELLHVILWEYTSACEDLSLKKARKHIRKMEEKAVSTLERMPLWDEVLPREERIIRLDK